MSNCRKIFLFILINLFSLFFFSSKVFSQTDNTVNDWWYKKQFFYAHGLYSIITDHTTNIRFHEGFGADAGGGFTLKSKLTSFCATAGFTTFRTLSDSIKTETYIPFKLGIREVLIRRLLFINADAGAGFILNKYPTEKTPNPASVRVAADIGVGVITKAGFEALCNLDTFKEPYNYGWTGCVVLKVGWRF